METMGGYADGNRHTYTYEEIKVISPSTILYMRWDPLIIMSSVTDEGLSVYGGIFGDVFLCAVYAAVYTHLYYPGWLQTTHRKKEPEH